MPDGAKETKVNTNTKLYRFNVLSGPAVAGLRRGREVLIVARSLEEALAVLRADREELYSTRYTVEETCTLPSLNL